MTSHLLPGDQAFPDDQQLLADLVSLNQQLTRYVVRYLDADAHRADPTSVANERALADVMATLASKVRERADRRTSSEASPALGGDATLRRLTGDRPSER
jgi:hypothetical protein